MMQFVSASPGGLGAFASTENDGKFVTPRKAQQKPVPWKGNTRYLSQKRLRWTVAWKQTAVPISVQEIGVTWLKTKVFVPKDWASLPMFLTIQAVDDNDITYFNGREIGRINGWDTLREYPVPKEIIRFGKANEIAIAVDNTNHGCGIASDFVFLGMKYDKVKTPLFPPWETQKEVERQAQRPIGKPLPLRPFVVRNGVLEYIDGGEVALWGNNYYPQS
ncbi:MAG: hypothetical protein FWH27_01680 [Planctomycetaceae bacterium]|nr:hypothetical protein [Planctomycetaceae bacterium]